MEIYVDEQTERVYVGYDRGPYRVLDRDGSIGESFIPRGADLVFGDGDAYAIGFDVGYAKGRAKGQVEEALAAARIAEADAAERRRLTFLAALRYHPLSVKSSRGRA